MADDIKYCVVCGAGSHRTDWVLKSGNFVACDSHSKDEFLSAMKKAQTSSTSKAGTTLPGQASATPAPSVEVVNDAGATKTAS